MWRLTFEFTRAAEAGVVSPVGDDATAGTRRAYNACRSGSGVQRVVRPRSRYARCAYCRANSPRLAARPNTATRRPTIATRRSKLAHHGRVALAWCSSTSRPLSVMAGWSWVCPQSADASSLWTSHSMEGLGLTGRKKKAKDRPSGGKCLPHELQRSLRRGALRSDGIFSSDLLLFN